MSCEGHDWQPVNFEELIYDSEMGDVIFVCKNEDCNKFKRESVEEIK